MLELSTWKTITRRCLIECLFNIVWCTLFAQCCILSGYCVDIFWIYLAISSFMRAHSPIGSSTWTTQHLDFLVPNQLGWTKLYLAAAISGRVWMVRKYQEDQQVFQGTFLKSFKLFFRRCYRISGIFISISASFSSNDLFRWSALIVKCQTLD